MKNSPSSNPQKFPIPLSFRAAVSLSIVMSKVLSGYLSRNKKFRILGIPIFCLWISDQKPLLTSWFWGEEDPRIRKEMPIFGASSENSQIITTLKDWFLPLKLSDEGMRL
jgi:hypothetical protein